jgi:hypothetical protein
MSKYLIHTCEKRKWYVDEYLVPSMIKQGIDNTNILIYNDEHKEGCLKSFISSSEMITTLRQGVWHLQDDIIISSNFKKVTEEFDKGIVCGFCSYYSEDAPIGIRPINDMWYSFPCIRIPNVVLKGFVKWINSQNTQNKYRVYIEQNKFVDLLFREYVTTIYEDKLIHNLCPNIVDNVDYLLGGSTINYIRDKQPVSLYFQEKNLIEELKHSLENTIYNKK